MQIKLTPAQERMQYTRQLYTYLTDRIFIDKKEALFKALYIIAEENQKLLGCKQATFMFNGRWYPYEKPLGLMDNKELHPSLREKVSQLIQAAEFDDREIRAGIQALIGNALAIARDASDIPELLPHQLTSGISLVDPDRFNSGPPLSEDEIAEFHEANKTNLAHLKRMLITQLLLAKA